MSEFVPLATIVNSAVSIVIALIYWRLYKVAERQVQATIVAAEKQVQNARQVGKMEMYIQITRLLSLDGQIRDDRLILQHHEGTEWSGDEREAAFRVCAAMNVAAVLVYADAVPKDLFIKQYGHVMRKTATQVESVVPETSYPDFRRLTKEANTE